MNGDSDSTPDTPEERDDKADKLGIERDATAASLELERNEKAVDVEYARVGEADRLKIEREVKAQILASDFQNFRWEMRFYVIVILLIVASQF